MSNKNKFIANRDFTMATLSGHSIAFVKGEATHVPKECQREALAHGAAPVGDEEVDMGDKKPSVQPEPDQRAELLKMILSDMKTRNAADEFTASGTPKVKAVVGLAGFDVSGPEIAELWASLTVQPE